MKQLVNFYDARKKKSEDPLEHHVLRVVVDGEEPNSLVAFALDLAGAQFDQHIPVMEWSAYRRVVIAEVWTFALLGTMFEKQGFGMTESTRTAEDQEEEQNEGENEEDPFEPCGTCSTCVTFARDHIRQPSTPKAHVDMTMWERLQEAKRLLCRQFSIFRWQGETGLQLADLLRAETEVYEQQKARYFTHVEIALGYAVNATEERMAGL